MPMALRDALDICGSPGENADRPSLYTMAWVTLKSARGQTVRQHRLRASHMIGPGADGEAA